MLHEQEQQGGDEEAGGRPRRQWVGPERRRPDEQRQRGSDGADRGASPERERVRGRGHDPPDEDREQDRTVGGGGGHDRGAQLVHAVAQSVGEDAERVDGRDAVERRVRRLRPDQVRSQSGHRQRQGVDEGPAARARHEAEEMRQQHRPDHGEHEPPGLEDASEGQDGRGAQRGERERGERGGGARCHRVIA